jgi:hypothetical protein
MSHLNFIYGIEGKMMSSCNDFCVYVMKSRFCSHVVGVYSQEFPICIKVREFSRIKKSPHPLERNTQFVFRKKLTKTCSIDKRIQKLLIFDFFYFYICRSMSEAQDFREKKMDKRK